MNKEHRHIALLAMCALLGASAARADHAATQAAPVDEDIQTADAEPQWRWIAERADALPGCPTLQPWIARSLFCEPAHNPDDGTCNVEAPIPPGLKNFCSYEYPPDMDVPDGAVIELMKLAGLTSIAPDPMGVAGFGSALQDETWKALATNFKEQTGRPPTPPFVPPVPMPLVRLAVVDTQPTSAVDADQMPHNSPHGDALLNMADELLCNDSGDCAARIVSRLALGYICPLDVSRNRAACRDPDLGGFLGTIGNLARAIRLETRTWIDPLVAGHRLILNLSVAWDPRFGGLEANVADMSPPIRAVYAAIADAQCRGALVLAASGNLTGGPESQSGPLLPAAWEQRPALTAAECTARLGVNPPDIFPIGADHRPFIYAVGGVTGDGGRLENARLDAEPSLVAFADHANVADESIPGPPPTPTATLTGSSVAALVASSAAAWTWFVADDQITPPKKPYEIMDLVYDTATRLGRPADFCLGGTSALPCPAPVPEVSEVQICQAIHAIGGPLDCPTTSPVDLPITGGGYFTMPLSALGQTMNDATCGAVTIHYSGAPPANPCPFAQYFSQLAEPWTTPQSPTFTAPQPPESPCPSCGGGHPQQVNAVAPATLYLEIDAARTWSLTDGTLQCGDQLYSLDGYLAAHGMSPLVAGSKVAVTLDAGNCDPAVHQRLYFRNGTGESVVDTLIEGIALDTDGDGVSDVGDNCTLVANPDQRDTDGDGIGNACDTDLTEDCITNFADLAIFKNAIFGDDPNSDFDGDGNVNFVDLGVMKIFFFLPPGPSGLPNACPAAPKP